jgi:hypothetical protein
MLALSGFFLLVLLVFAGWQDSTEYRLEALGGGGAVYANTAWIPVLPFILAGVLVFMIGFYWKFRRLSRTRS